MSSALGVQPTVTQQSSSTSSTPTPHSVSIWACRHYLMSLSFCAAEVGVGGGSSGCCYAEHQHATLIQPHVGTSLSRLSHQIKYLSYNLYIFFSISLFLLPSLCVCCPLQVDPGTCLLGVHQAMM